MRTRHLTAAAALLAAVDAVTATPAAGRGGLFTGPACGPVGGPVSGPVSGHRAGAMDVRA
ncbi:hypothetical protein Misp01_03300 [Microtetraspora sp. NBRC 13810]|uniref:hypothetical protein n=1 Tax=Microtetraspora sp. NBRC 13810 TaxID=3030990 RepID=UPI0024A076C1|nr:hypothetical protein [Microtetraspora sp. NBRC 13810]GLW05200.1 hypothetical protein Misp01_03300 [Microtetraspora sp. NBRC 13810]